MRKLHLNFMSNKINMSLLEKIYSIIVCYCFRCYNNYIYFSFFSFRNNFDHYNNILQISLLQFIFDYYNLLSNNSFPSQKKHNGMKMKSAKYYITDMLKRKEIRIRIFATQACFMASTIYTLSLRIGLEALFVRQAFSKWKLFRIRI